MSKPIFTSAADVETAFYETFARGDLDAMMALWSEDEEVVCIHPDSVRVVGLAAVRESWRQIFASGARLQVHTTQRIVCANMMLTVHNVMEQIAVEGDEAMHPPMIATNVYVRGALGWRMVMHHASGVPELQHLPGHDTPRTVH